MKLEITDLKTYLMDNNKVWVLAFTGYIEGMCFEGTLVNSWFYAGKKEHALLMGKDWREEILSFLDTFMLLQTKQHIPYRLGVGAHK